IPALVENADAELVAVCRRSPEELEKVRSAFAIPFAFTDYRTMLDSIDLDGVIVASPHPQHFEQACAALRRGLHVLVDKPMTTNAGEARTLVALAAKSGREILVPYGWNFKDFSREAR